VFKLKTPIHIAYLPLKGSVVSQTRYFIPGRNLWGALTKRITEFINEEPEPEHYKNIGSKTSKADKCCHRCVPEQ